MHPYPVVLFVHLLALLLAAGATVLTFFAALQLRDGIAFTTRFYSRGADLIELARTVSGVEPDLGAMWQEGETRRLRRYSALAAEWERAGALAPGLTAAAARDIAWAMSGPDMFRLFVLERRWSLTRYQDWLRGTLESVLFG